jgi:hypothetical protein
VGGHLPTAAEWLGAAFTEQRATPSALWQRGTTYPWPTGNTPQGANTGEPDRWPRSGHAGQMKIHPVRRFSSAT